MSVLHSFRAAFGTATLVVLAGAPLRAQLQHSHADSTRADSARKQPSARMPMDMPMRKHDSTTKAKPTAKKSVPKKVAKPPAAAGVSPARHDSSTRMPGMAGMSSHDAIARDTTGHGGGHVMMTGALGISTERMGSGTTWLPDAVSLPSRHIPAKGWDVMLHGFVFGQYDRQGGPRGDSQLGSLNWGMLMASRAVAGGMFQARTMLSLDPATVGNRGYPLLLQSGEAYQGEPLHDRQHPHDFLMELGVLYERPFTSALAWSVYAAPSGEPALGPVAFMHRPSAMDIPTANITHHWQDATHISFGVLTGGIFTRRVKLEGSVFNGREPDEQRWNVDPIRFDSYSGRLTVNPTEHWSLTAGYGYLKSPEALHPAESLHRVTASVLHGTKLGDDGQWSSAFVWGANQHPGHDATNGTLVESEAILDTHNTVFARAEYVEKTAGDLVLAASSGSLPAGATFGDHQVFDVGAITFGYIRDIGRWKWATIGAGAQGTVNFVPGWLENVYGSRTPLGGLVFVRLRPFHARGSAMAPMGGMRM